MMINDDRYDDDDRDDYYVIIIFIYDDDKCDKLPKNIIVSETSSPGLNNSTEKIKVPEESATG